MKIPWTVEVRQKISLSGVLPEINNQWNEKNVCRKIRGISEDVENDPRTGFVRRIDFSCRSARRNFSRRPEERVAHRLVEADRSPSRNAVHRILFPVCVGATCGFA